MYIYNVTINIDESVHDPWLKWMRDIHIPDMLATGKFTEAKMCRVMVEEEMGGITYSIQYLAKSKEDLDAYYAVDASTLRKKVFDKFGDAVVAFRTELQIINEFQVDTTEK